MRYSLGRATHAAPAETLSLKQPPPRRLSLSPETRDPSTQPGSFWLNSAEMMTKAKAIG